MKDNIQKMNFTKLFTKLVNRETITYIIAGVLTTLVNFCSYMLFYYVGFKDLTANAIAWVVAVTFAYIVNKITVFRSKSVDLNDEITKIVKFFGARLVTLGIEQLGMYIFIYIIGINHLIVKAGLAVIIVVLNYILSKLWIFYKKKEQ